MADDPGISIPCESTSFPPLTPDQLRDSRYHYRPGTCSHQVLIRWFSTPEQPLRCGGCNKPTRFLYVCAANTEEWDTYYASDPSLDLQRLDPSNDYNDVQIERLIKQQLEVLVYAKIARKSVIDRPAEQRFNISGIKAASLVKTRHDGHRGRFGRLRDDIYRQQVAQAKSFKRANVPCRLEVCSECHPSLSWIERATGHILQVVEAPYKPLPNIPEYLSRPISSAQALLRPTLQDEGWVDSWIGKVKRGHWFASWQEAMPSLDLTELLRLAAHLNLRRLGIFELFDWVGHQSLSELELSGFVEWMILQRFDPETVHFYLRSATRDVKDPGWYRQVLVCTDTSWSIEDRGRRTFRSGSRVRTSLFSE